MKYFFFLFCILFGFSVFSQSKTDLYIAKYATLAVSEMNEFGIPASIILSQGILESGNGESYLAREGKNHFGIKCHGWEGMKIYADDDAENECFRKYKKVEQSYRDHSEFLTTHRRYSSLFELKITDYKGWAKGLKKCGYATNPKYANLLITLIERHDLSRLDSERAEEEVTVADADKTEDVQQREEVAQTNPSTYIGTQSQTRDVRTTDHGVQFIIARKGDSPKSLSHDLEMMTWQFRRYNEVSKEYVFAEGEKVYLQPKKNFASYSWHVVRSNQTLWDISQIYGMKTSALRRKNNLEKDEALVKGMRLSLKWPLTNEGKLPWYAQVMGAGKTNLE